LSHESDRGVEVLYAERILIALELTLLIVEEHCSRRNRTDFASSVAFPTGW